MWRRVWAIGAVLWILALPVGADEALAPEALQKLKRATVFLKVAVGPLNSSGSGFVVQTVGKSTYLVTNEHVVAKPDINFDAVPIGLRGRSIVELRRWQRVWGELQPEVTAVLNSSTPQEQAVPATVLAVDPHRDLAILEVKDLKSPPDPISLDQDYQPLETTPVFILGFPFGEALSLDQGNPAISVGRGSISSLRLDEGQREPVVQIDGALNPGNSGGPVVDGKGRLVGVAVSTIRGAGIGFAIPPATLQKVLAGSVSQITVASKDSQDAWLMELTLKIVDPFHRVKKVAVLCLPRESKSDGRAPLPDSELLELVLKDGQAVGTWKIPKSVSKPTQITLQPALSDADGQPRLMAATTHPVFGAASPAAGATPQGLRLSPRIVTGRPAVRDHLKTSQGFVRDVADRKIAGGMFAIEKKGRSFGFGLTQTGEAASRCSYLLAIRLPASGFDRATFSARNRTRQNRITFSYTAFIDDESITLDHSFSTETSPPGNEQLTILAEKYDPADGRVFLVDLRQSPLKVTQKNIELTREFPLPPLEEDQLLSFGQQALDDIEKSDDSVRKFWNDK